MDMHDRKLLEDGECCTNVLHHVPCLNDTFSIKLFASKEGCWLIVWQKNEELNSNGLAEDNILSGCVLSPTIGMAIGRVADGDHGGVHEVLHRAGCVVGRILCGRKSGRSADEFLV
jgi:hypothetical protein